MTWILQRRKYATQFPRASLRSSFSHKFTTKLRIYAHLLRRRTGAPEHQECASERGRRHHPRACSSWSRSDRHRPKSCAPKEGDTKHTEGSVDRTGVEECQTHVSKVKIRSREKKVGKSKSVFGTGMMVETEDAQSRGFVNPIFPLAQNLLNELILPKGFDILPASSDDTGYLFKIRRGLPPPEQGKFLIARPDQ